ncbi:hypothetical protein [Mesorhizobium sp. WSM4313]|uniref:hypothetical protein n=1 Tax=Mesorhizobium sp. WSM4313 TaxID=2029412 RepID=UPI000BAEAF0E|nr:hypothetical protein [Mesorhizobium sp. WSM4313]PBB20543.1 hypothetical protein CK219_05235 [Mesorhizobium sp. WSM4313]
MDVGKHIAYLAPIYLALTCSAHADDPARQARQIALQDAWSTCLKTFAKRAATKTNEDATIISRGAFAACQAKEDILYKFYIQGMPKAWSDFVRTDFFPTVKKHEEDSVIQTVLEARS